MTGCLPPCELADQIQHLEVGTKNLSLESLDPVLQRQPCKQAQRKRPQAAMLKIVMHSNGDFGCVWRIQFHIARTTNDASRTIRDRYANDASFALGIEHQHAPKLISPHPTDRTEEAMQEGFARGRIDRRANEGFVLGPNMPEAHHGAIGQRKFAQPFRRMK